MKNKIKYKKIMIYIRNLIQHKRNNFNNKENQIKLKKN